MVPTARTNNLVVIEKKTEVEGKWNNVVKWVEFQRAWVSINPDRGREISKGDERKSIVTHTVRGDLLSLENVTEEMRIIYNPQHDYEPINPNSRIFAVLALMPDIDLRADMMIQVDLQSLSYGQTGSNVTE